MCPQSSFNQTAMVAGRDVERLLTCDARAPSMRVGLTVGKMEGVAAVRLGVMDDDVTPGVFVATLDVATSNGCDC